MASATGQNKESDQPIPYIVLCHGARFYDRAAVFMAHNVADLGFRVASDQAMEIRAAHATGGHLQDNTIGGSDRICHGFNG
mgnify:CR=1 FL=1